MADTVKRAPYSYATVDDTSGEGARLLDTLKREGVNLVAFHAFPSGSGKSQLDLFAQDPAKLAAAAQKAGVTLSATKHALLIEGADRPGAIAELLTKLAGAKINVTAGEAVRSGDGRFGGIIWVKPADLDQAAQALAAQ